MQLFANQVHKVLKSKWCIQCSHIWVFSVHEATLDLVEEGWNFYNIFHGRGTRDSTNKREHFSCMADLLALVGCLYEAEAFIKNTGFDLENSIFFL